MELCREKQRKVKPTDGPFVGDQYIFLGASSSSKAIVSFQVGKRNEENTKAFVWDLRERIINARRKSQLTRLAHTKARSKRLSGSNVATAKSSNPMPATVRWTQRTAIPPAM